MYFVSSFLARAINASLGSELMRFANCCIAVHTAGQQFVWRINANGKLTAVSPLIHADCTLRWKNGKLHISGDGELLAVLSEFVRQGDYLLMISNCFGERLAPSVLYRLEQASEQLKNKVAQHLATPQKAAEYRDQVQQLHKRVVQVGQRFESVLATISREVT
ncbi:MAG: hypothetical protein K0U15_04480 [Proteobacteria bacterium]|nr:hypothetical protein [Pseudomonadota bacterium]